MFHVFSHIHWHSLVGGSNLAFSNLDNFIYQLSDTIRYSLFDISEIDILTQFQNR